MAPDGFKDRGKKTLKTRLTKTIPGVFGILMNICVVFKRNSEFARMVTAGIHSQLQALVFRSVFISPSSVDACWGRDHGGVRRTHTLHPLHSKHLITSRRLASYIVQRILQIQDKTDTKAGIGVIALEWMKFRKLRVGVVTEPSVNQCQQTVKQMTVKPQC